MFLHKLYLNLVPHLRSTSHAMFFETWLAAVCDEAPQSSVLEPTLKFFTEHKITKLETLATPKDGELEASEGWSAG